MLSDLSAAASHPNRRSQPTIDSDMDIKERLYFGKASQIDLSAKATAKEKPTDLGTIVSQVSEDERIDDMPDLRSVSNVPDLRISSSPKQAPTLLGMKQKISGEELLPPDWFRYNNENRRKTLNVSYRICLAKNGTVNKIEPVLRIEEIDDFLMEKIKNWRYKPPLIPFCFIESREYYFE